MRQALLIIIGFGFLLLGIGVLADIGLQLKENIGGNNYLEYREVEDRLIEGCVSEFDVCDEE